jgi:hypothetical protein
MCGDLEHGLGTAAFVGVIIQLTLVGNVLYVVVASLIAVAAQTPAVLEQCAAGFSGVLFGLMIVEIRLRSGSESRTQLGPFSINPWLFPW